MADEADIASELQAREIKMARDATANSSKAKHLPATGKCHYCEADVADGVRFCDEDCAADWEREQRLTALAKGPKAAHAGAFARV